MDKVLWLLPNRLGGRAGPNREPWDLEEFRAQGVSLVISLTERIMNQSSQFFNLGIDHALTSPAVTGER